MSTNNDEKYKVKGKMLWKWIHEFTTDIVYRSKSGGWYHKTENGGWGGAWQDRRDTVTAITAEEAAMMLNEWRLMRTGELAQFEPADG